MTISALDKDTVKLITTTQVITSIYSAAKELIENALDANAKSIEINLVDNGSTLIEVKDDGCGISKDDAVYMALSSYTSKIFTFSDLESLETYGFRGEALHALCSVSDLTIISKTEQDEVAVSYNIDHCGHIVKAEPCHRATGTTVQVRQLFKQMPVRRQIVLNSKTAGQDLRTLETLIKSYGLCKFSTRFSYKVDNTIVFAKPATLTLEEAVTYTLGKKVTSSMSWLNITEAETKMKIMIPSKEAQNTPEIFQSGAQYIFVNNRPIKYKVLEKTLTKVILEALEKETSSRKKPIFVLYILTNAANIDVNLEPNKSSILFKDQDIVVNTVERHLENFYDIHREEVQQGGSSDYSIAEYQDYTQNSIGKIDDERPACKKRKLQAEERVVKLDNENENINKNVEDSLLPTEQNFKHAEQVQSCESDKHSQDEHTKKFGEDVKELDIEIPPLILSDTDSNDSQKFKSVYTDTAVLHSSLKKITDENIEDSPPFELTPKSETFSQLPIVDLGDDFSWDNSLNVNTDEKINHEQSVPTENSRTECNLDLVKPSALKEWSKGHVTGLKAGTDIHAHNYTEPCDLKNHDAHSRVCEGFLRFSKHMRPQVLKEYSSGTAPEIARALTNLWKKLSPEERGYYRDLARDEKLEDDVPKQLPKQKHQLDASKSKNRLLRALEKMKTMNLEKKENLVMRTTVSWDIKLNKIRDCFLNNSPCKNTNSVIGLLCSNLWVIHKSAHIWILDVRNLRKQLPSPDTNMDEENAGSIEVLLQRWFSTKDDLSLLHPIHSLTQNAHNCNL